MSDFNDWNRISLLAYPSRTKSGIIQVQTNLRAPFWSEFLDDYKILQFITVCVLRLNSLMSILWCLVMSYDVKQNVKWLIFGWIPSDIQNQKFKMLNLKKSKSFRSSIQYLIKNIKYEAWPISRNNFVTTLLIYYKTYI